MDQQQIQQNIGGLKSNTPPVIHSEPNALYEETCRRLEHYNSQIDKLEMELKRVTLMRNVLAAAQNAFDKHTEMPDQVPGGREY